MSTNSSETKGYKPCSARTSKRKRKALSRNVKACGVIAENAKECHEHEEQLTVKDWLELFNLLKIDLPEGILNEQVVACSRNTDIINDAKAIAEDLKNLKLQIVLRPRLTCEKIAQVLQLKEQLNILEITRMTFFEPFKSSHVSLKEMWKNYTSNTSCGFKIKDTFKELLCCTDGATAKTGNLAFHGELKCLKFYIEQENICHKYSKKKHEVEYGFFSARSVFSVENPCETSTIPANKFIIECTGFRDNMGDLSTLADEGCEIKINVTTEHYYQVLASMYILENVQQSPSNAELVIKEFHDNEKVDKDEFFYYGKVTDDLTCMKELNKFFKENVLPRFLAVLSLIFEKMKTQNDQEVHPMTVDDYQTLLKLLSDHLPEEIITPVIEPSTQKGTKELETLKDDLNTHCYYHLTQDCLQINKSVQNSSITVEVKIKKNKDQDERLYTAKPDQKQKQGDQTHQRQGHSKTKQDQKKLKEIKHHKDKKKWNQKNLQQTKDQHDQNDLYDKNTRFIYAHDKNDMKSEENEDEQNEKHPNDKQEEKQKRNPKDQQNKGAENEQLVLQNQLAQKRKNKKIIKMSFTKRISLCFLLLINIIVLCLSFFLIIEIASMSFQEDQL